MAEANELADVFNAIGALCKVYHNNPSQTLRNLSPALVELLHRVIVTILNDMQLSMEDAQVQSNCMQLLRALWANNALIKGIILERGGLNIFGYSMQRHLSSENILLDVFAAVDEMQGFRCLLKLMLDLLHNASASRLALHAIKQAVKYRWKEVQHMPVGEVIQGILSVASAHATDTQILELVLQIVREICWKEVNFRSDFAAANGWQWLLDALEMHSGNVQVQLQGVKLVSELCKGGSWGEAFAPRAADVIASTIHRHSREEDLVYWGIWAIQELNGASALLKSLRTGDSGDLILVSALRSLSCLSWGQADNAGSELVQPVVETVIQTMQSHHGQPDVMLEGASALGKVAHYACCLGPNAVETVQCACVDALRALVDLLKVCFTNENTSENLATRILETLVSLMDALNNDSPVRRQLVEALSNVPFSQLSNVKVQAKLFRLSGATCGAVAILQEMDRNLSSHVTQKCGVQALAELYFENLEISVSDATARPDALQVVAKAMQRFPENLVLQQHCCFALSAIVDHGTDESVTNKHLMICFNAACQALRLVKGRCDAKKECASYNSLYLRKEAARLVVSVFCAMPSLRREFHDDSLTAILADAFMATASGVAEGKRDPDAEETMEWELLALASVKGPEVIAESLYKWGATKPAVVKAAACTVVQLVRQNPAEILKLQGELQSKGCCSQLVAAMNSQFADDEIQQHLHLAYGFSARRIDDCLPAAAAPLSPLNA